MKNSEKALNARYTAYLLILLVIGLILEPVGVLFALFWLFVWTTQKGSKSRRRMNQQDWAFDEEINNKPQWSDSTSHSSSSSNWSTDTIYNPAYSQLPSNIYHRK